MKLATQILKYGATAGCAAVVDLGLFWVINGFGVKVLVAAALSFLIATVVNYLLSARYVFAAGALSIEGYVRFLAGASVGFLVNVGVTWAAHGVFEVVPILAKAIGIGIAFFANFALNKMFVFRNS